MAWTDSQNVSSTVATTSETQLGSTIQIPQGQKFDIYTIYFSSNVGGTGRMEIDTYPSAQFKWIQNGDNEDELGDSGSGTGYPTAIQVNGPASLKLYTTNSAATSGTSRAQINYRVTITSKSGAGA